MDPQTVFYIHMSGSLKYTSVKFYAYPDNISNVWWLSWARTILV